MVGDVESGPLVDPYAAVAAGLSATGLTAERLGDPECNPLTGSAYPVVPIGINTPQSA